MNVRTFLWSALAGIERCPGSFFMVITKKINNNVAMARDDRGNEFVVFGRGIGFPQTPYLLTDESLIQGVFSNIDNGVLSMIRGIKSEIIDVALEIMDTAKTELGCKLNPNAFVTLADHLQFAADRMGEGIVLDNPLAGTVEFVYPKEYEIGKYGLKLFAEATGIELPPMEACSIAMHIADSLSDGERASDMSEVMRTLSSIDEVTNIIERSLNITVDRSSYNYARFTTHVRYLIKRMLNDQIAASPNTELFARVASDFPEVCACAEEICTYLQESYNCESSDEEKLYLMMYINRFLVSR